jgi:peptidoglycan/xylan/chitin deacetylase (PgdA/CDA1 family)
LLDRHCVPATVLTPGRICELYPQALRVAVARGHEIADHMWEHHVPNEASLAEDHLAKMVAALERISGSCATHNAPPTLSAASDSAAGTSAHNSGGPIGSSSFA